jgi:transcriptional regulator with XRE-family HTH domain
MTLEAETAPSAGDDTHRPSLAQRLKAYRAKRGISQSQAARELDIARTAYRLWELEAAHPSPDRWRLVARWLGVSMTTLLLAEGLISEEEGRQSEEASTKFEAATGQTTDVAAEHEPGDFFRQAQSLIDRSLERGIITADEAGNFRDMFGRIQTGLSQQPRP